MLNDMKLIFAGDMKELSEIVQKDGAGQAIRNIYGYILAAGSVRHDVYEFLLSHTEFELYSIQFINDLIKYFAEPEWFELISVAEKKSEKGEKICRLYQQSIVNAFRERLNPDEVKQVIESATYPYELDLWVEGKKNSKEQVALNESNMELSDMIKCMDIFKDKLAGIFNKHERILFELLELAESHNKILVELLEDSKREHPEVENNTIVLNVPPANNECAVESISDEESQNKNEDSVISEAEEPTIEEHIPVNEPVKKTQKMNSNNAASIGHFFQRIRNKKHKSEFLKLDEHKKIEELFMLMRQKDYNKELVGSVRKCIEYGVSSEFLYVFIESGAEWADFETLIAFVTKSKDKEADQ